MKVESTRTDHLSIVYEPVEPRQRNSRAEIWATDELLGATAYYRVLLIHRGFIVKASTVSVTLDPGVQSKSVKMDQATAGEYSVSSGGPVTCEHWLIGTILLRQIRIGSSTPSCSSMRHQQQQPFRMRLRAH